MRVGVVTTSYPRFPDDPAGNFVGEHVRALRELGHDVEVIAAGEDAHDSGGLGDRRDIGRDIARGGLHVERVPSRGLFYAGGAPDLLEREPRRALSAAMFTVRLTAAVVGRRWDSIVAHWLAPSALACLPTTAPLLAIAHGGDVHTLRRANLLGPALHLLRARDAQLVFVSEELRALSIEAAPRLATWLSMARVQPMGIDLARFASIPRTPTSPPTIAIAARLVPIKGVDVAIAALEHVEHRVSLTIAGDGPELASLREAAAVYPLAFALASAEEHCRVEFLGEIDTRARDRLLATASIVLVPSRRIGIRPSAPYVRANSPDDTPDSARANSPDDARAASDHARAGRTEGTPLIALEALAAGIPVIASDVGGLRSLRGVVRVPPDDPRALADAIDRVLDAPPDSAELRESVAHLDWRHVIGTLVRNP